MNKNRGKIITYCIFFGILIYFPSQLLFDIQSLKQAHALTNQAGDTVDATTLTICLGQEPDSLYLYGSSMLTANSVLQAVYDGPIDNRTYAYQAVILEKLPRLLDGDVVIQEVSVTSGDTVVDEFDNVVTLDNGVKVRPAGCNVPDCVIEYNGGLLNMDQMVVTYKLLPNLTWSDGVPLTASDSVYSYYLNMHPDTPAPSRYLVDHTASYTAVDDLTTMWIGFPGFKEILYNRNFFSPLPQHIYGNYSPNQLVYAEVSSRKPIGWGPYVIDQWFSGDRITMHKNTRYFRASEGFPRFDNLVYKFIGEDSVSNIAALISGECDIVDQTAHLDNQFEQILQLDKSGDLKANVVTGSVWEHIDFGIQHVSYDDGYDGGINDRPDFFSDVRMRRAFAYCMDRQKVVDEVMWGQSVVLDTYLPPSHPLLNPEIFSYKFDPESGNNLLTQVGWIDLDGDGVREAHGVRGVPDGTMLEVSYETTTALERQYTTHILSNSLSECGIKVNVYYYSAAEWFSDGPEGRLFGRKFDLGQFAWLTGFRPVCDLYLSSQVPGPVGTWIPIMNPKVGPMRFTNNWGGQNEVGYYNPIYDSICIPSLRSIEGEPGYITNHFEAQRIFAEDLPVVPLYLRLKLAASRPDIGGLIIDSSEISEFWNIEEFERYFISGQITEVQTDNPIDGVIVTAGNNITTTTDQNGYFTLNGVKEGIYKITPSKKSLAFSPPFRNVTIPPVATGQDFIGSGDSDDDSLYDIWELSGYDADGDGSVDVNLPAMGADPDHKDIFVEVDYMEDEICIQDHCIILHTHRPNPDAIALIVDTFRDAPISNIDGVNGINLHVDFGSDTPMDSENTWGGLSKSNILPHDDEINWQEFYTIKGNPDYFDPARKDIFHYTIFAHFLEETDDVGPCTSGQGYRPGFDFIVSLGGWGGRLSRDGCLPGVIARNSVGTLFQQAGTFMHELGHNLSLQHGGGDSINGKPNYLSIMNYAFQMSGLIYDGKDGGTFDYSRSDEIPDLIETNLNETLGLNGDSSTESYGTTWRCPNGEDRSIIHANDPINWNCNEIDNETDINANINDGWERDNPSPPDEVLNGFNDWACLSYDGTSIVCNETLNILSTTNNLPVEMTLDQYNEISHPYDISLTGSGGMIAPIGYTSVYTFTLTNAGENSDTYTINAASSLGWVDITTIPSTITLLSGESYDFIIDVAIPVTAKKSDNDTLKIIASSEGNPALWTSAYAITKVMNFIFMPVIVQSH